MNNALSATQRQPKHVDAVERLLSRLDGVRIRGEGWKALCPAHDDHRPSLHVDVEGHRILIVCASRRCSAERIVEAIGLRLADLFMPENIFKEVSLAGLTDAQLAQLDDNDTFWIAAEAMSGRNYEVGRPSTLWSELLSCPELPVRLRALAGRDDVVRQDSELRLHVPVFDGFGMMINVATENTIDPFCLIEGSLGSWSDIDPTGDVYVTGTLMDYLCARADELPVVGGLDARQGMAEMIRAVSSVTRDAGGMLHIVAYGNREQLLLGVQGATMCGLVMDKTLTVEEQLWTTR